MNRSFLRRISVRWRFLAWGAWLSLCLLVPDQARPRECRIGAGRKGGGLYLIVDALKTRLESRNSSLSLDIAESNGSCQNIEDLLAGRVAFGLVQYDIASEAVMASSTEAATETPKFPVQWLGSWPCLDPLGSDCPLEACQEERLPDHPLDQTSWMTAQNEGESMWMCGISPWMASLARLKVIAGVGDESVHLLVRNPLMFDDFSGLSGYRIYLGRPLSGSYETAKVILGAAGLVAEKVHYPGSWRDAVQEIRNPQSDLIAILRTVSPGDPEISRLIQNGLVNIQSLPEDMIRRLIEAHPYYRPCEIPKGTYPGMGPRAVQTICVDTVLLTNTAIIEGATDNEVEDLLQALEDLEQHPQNATESQIQLKWRDFGDEDRVELHPVARTRLRQETTRSWMRPMLPFGVLGFFLLAVLLLRRRLKKSPPSLQGGFVNTFENPVLPVVAIVALMWLSAVTVQKIEQPINPAIQKVTDAFWSMASFATGNFESDRLKNFWSRLIGILTTLAGLGVLAWFTASLTALFTTGRVLWRKRYAGHVIVINAHDALFRLVEVLRSPGPLRIPIVHILAKNLPVRHRNRLLRIRGVLLHDLDAEVTADLRLLCPEAARRVIVLGERAEIDGRSSVPGFHAIRVVRAIRLASSQDGNQVLPPTRPPDPIRALAGSEVNHRFRGSLHPWTVIDSDHENASDLLHENTEWVVAAPTRRLLEYLLAKAAFQPSFATMVTHLLSYQDANAEIWTVLLPRSSASWTWRSVRERLVGASPRLGVTPFGIFRPSGDQAGSLQSPCSPLPGGVLLNPPPGFLVREGDSLIALAEDEKTLLKAVNAAFPKKSSRPTRPG